MFRRALLLADISASSLVGRKHDRIDAIVNGLTNAIHKVSPLGEEYFALIVVPVAELMEWGITEEDVLDSVRAHALAEQLADYHWEFDISVDDYQGNLKMISLKIQKTAAKTGDVGPTNAEPAPAPEPAAEIETENHSDHCLCGEKITDVFG